jgi:hypothetical protein
MQLGIVVVAFECLRQQQEMVAEALEATISPNPYMLLLVQF